MADSMLPLFGAPESEPRRDNSRCSQSSVKTLESGPVAQRIEHRPSKAALVVGSNPTGASTVPLAVVIPLSSGKCALIDWEDLDRVCALKWSACWIESGWYAKTWNHGQQVYLHRFIARAGRGEMVDHHNGDTLDCRKQNLRRATSLQNNLNRAANRANPTGFKGVRKRGGKFTARIAVRGERTFLGAFPTAEAAARAYDAAAIRLHGEFARLNFPQRSAEAQESK